MVMSKSVFKSLAISYALIVIIIVFLLYTIFYIYFPNTFNEEIRHENQIILENTSNYIETVAFKRAEKIFAGLSTEKSGYADFFTSNALKGNYSRVSDIQEYLLNLVANNSDIVSAIHLYYVKSKFMISSAYGLKYADGLNRLPDASMDWVKKSQSVNTGTFWESTHMVSQDIFAGDSDRYGYNQLITYIHSYPFNSTCNNCNLLVAIDLKAEYISKIVKDIMSNDYKYTFIVNENGLLISADDDKRLGTSIKNESYSRRLLSSKSDTESFTENIGNVPYIVSYKKFASNNWKLFIVTPEKNFYRKSITLQQIILLLCLLTIIVGLILSGVFTFANYNPLKQLLKTIRSLFDDSSEAGTAGQNEYTIIDSAIGRLASMISSLEDTLAFNKPLIKHNVVINALNGRYGKEELNERFQSFNQHIDYTDFCCGIIDPSSLNFKGLETKNSQYIIYSLINRLEAADFPETVIIAEELPETKIAVLVCTNKLNDELINKLSSFILSEEKNIHNLEFKISWGSWINDIANINKSYKEACILIKYCYFYAETSVFQDLSLIEKENSKEKFPQALIQGFTESLQTRNLENTSDKLEKIIVQMKAGFYPAEYCRLLLLDIVDGFAGYKKSMRLDYRNSDKADLYKKFNEINNIESFREWLIDSVSELYAYIEKRSEDRNTNCVEAVKIYIENHLAEELSLDTVASKVFISPKYLSKVFKEETGINYIDFVTAKRMDKAVELMSDGNLSIEQLAASVGYGTSAYFIKKFKEIHGCTPKTYIRNINRQEQRT